MTAWASGIAAVLVAALAAAPGAGFSARWVGQLQVDDDRRERLTLDLARQGEGWVGHFSLANTPLEAYPLVVEPVGDDALRLLFTGIESATVARLAAGGALLVLDFAPGTPATPDTIQLHRQGPPQLDAGYLAMLEAGAGELVVLDPAGEALRERFDADRDAVRLLVMLSPT